MKSLCSILLELFRDQKEIFYTNKNFYISYSGKTITFSPISLSKKPKFRSIINNLKQKFTIYSVQDLKDGSILVQLLSENDLGKVVDYIENLMDKEGEQRRNQI